MLRQILRNPSLSPKVSLFLLITSLVSASYDPSACNNSPALCSVPYASLTHFGTHNSPFLRDSSTGYSLSGNQYFNVTVQLDAGVRLLQGQLHDNNGVPTLCHSSCSLLNAGTLESYLTSVRNWMRDHQSEVVTILLVNDDKIDPKKLLSAFSKSDIEGIAYVPKNGEKLRQFPTLKQMIDGQKRVVVFLSAGANQQEVPFLLDEFTYIWETKWENTDAGKYSCGVDRPGAYAARNTGGDERAGVKQAQDAGLVPLVNWYLYNNDSLGILSPNVDYIKTTNGPTGVGSLGQGLSTCINSSTWSSLPAPRHPTYVLVDFFNEGPAIQQIDNLNNLTNPVNRVKLGVTPSSSNTKASTDGDGDLSNGGGETELEELVRDVREEGMHVKISEWILAAGNWGSGFAHQLISGTEGSWP